MTPFLGQLLAQHDVVLALDHLADPALILVDVAKSRELRHQREARYPPIVVNRAARRPR